MLNKMKLERRVNVSSKMSDERLFVKTLTEKLYEVKLLDLVVSSFDLIATVFLYIDIFVVVQV